MKKAMVLLAVTCVLCGLASAGGKGAVKTDLVDFYTGEIVGWVTVTGDQILNVHVKDGAPDLEAVVYTDGASDELTTNKNGVGNANLQLDTAATETYVVVVAPGVLYVAYPVPMP